MKTMTEQCKVCGKWFQHENSYNEKKFICGNCGDFDCKIDGDHINVKIEGWKIEKRGENVLAWTCPHKYVYGEFSDTFSEAIPNKRICKICGRLESLIVIIKPIADDKIEYKEAYSKFYKIEDLTEAMK